MRPTIKVKLSAKPDHWQSAGIVDKWKAQRAAARNLADAIRLYDALQGGDISTLLQMFPAMRIVLSMGGGLPALPPLPVNDAPIELVESDAATQEENLGGMFDLEF